MNILVTGANGQLGNWMRGLSVGSSDSFVFTDVADASDEAVATLRRLFGAAVPTATIRLDITDAGAVATFVKANAIDVVVNCAAYTNVDAAESNYGLAERLNADGPANLASAMKAVGGLLVHISTDYVFGKEPYNTPCREDQKGTPTGVYGLTKLHGEEKIIASGASHIILRTAWLYSEFGKNFVRTMLALTATKPSLKVVFDQVGTPTYAGDLAKAILAILPTAKANPGIYNYSGEGAATWFDLTKAIQEYTGNTNCEVVPCHSDEFPSPVTRPAYSVLDKTKIKETFGLKVPYWTSSLKLCLKNINR